MTQVRIVEVGPRDGLQNIATSIPTPTKIELIKRLHKAGLKTIELTSVVSPKAVPQLADNSNVLSNPFVKGLLSDPGLKLPVLVPNIRGLDGAIQHGVKEVAVFVSATESFSRANTNCSVEEGLARAREVATKAVKHGISVRGYVSCIFADPYEGKTNPSAVLHVVRELLAMGCYEVSLGDTLGVGTAHDIRTLLDYLRSHQIPLDKLAGHFHDTYGQGVSNVWQAYQCGLRTFDSSVGGLGGCPFAPGAKGNVATEDLVYLYQQANISTGVDLDLLTQTGSWISEQLSKRNDSRAGAAILAKRQKSSQQPDKTRTSSRPRIAWKLFSEEGDLRMHRSGANVKVVLNRPNNGNALTVSMITSITKFLHSIQDDLTISRIVICGTGKFFCTGQDLGAGSSPVGQSESVSEAQYNRLFPLFDAIDRAPQVTIACINGSAYGGGIGLAFACDVRLAVKTASMTLSEAKLGLTPATISKYVTREWGSSLAREAMLSARPVSVEELYRLGKIARLADDAESLDGLLDEYLSGLRSVAPHASKLCKDLVRLDYEAGGGEKQAKGIKEQFIEMMDADGEGGIGLKHFQAKDLPVDWDKIVQAKRGAKL